MTDMSSSKIKRELYMGKVESNCCQIVEKYFLSEESVLHQEQKQALTNIIEWFEHSEKIAVVVMPTGTGKTGIISCLPYMFGWAVKNEKIAYDLSNPMLLIAPGLSILNQLKQEIKHGADHPNPFLIKCKVLPRDDHDLIYQTYVVENSNSVRNLDLERGKSDVVISNAQKWKKGDEDIPNYEKLPDHLFSAVVIDEAHHLPAYQWQQIVDKFKKHAKIIFFTATPHRQDNQVITLNQPLKFPEHFAYILSKEVAIQNGLIREVNFIDLRDANEEDVLSAIISKLKEKNRVCPLPDNIKHQAIIITQSKIHAEKIETTCKGKVSPTRVVAIHSGLSRGSQESILQKIKNNKYDLIIIVGQLLEGFDHPPLSVAGILTKIRSKIKFAQFVGRIQRLVRAPSREQDGIVGNIITSSRYEQGNMFKKYTDPIIPETDEDLIIPDGDEEELEE